MAAYGLYTHIQSNKRRSVALLIGLFFLVYVMVFAGALLAEALTSYVDTVLRHRRDEVTVVGPQTSAITLPVAVIDDGEEDWMAKV